MTDLYDYHNGPNLGLEPPAAPQGEPSDEEIEALALAHGINKSDEHWGSRYYTELGSSLFSFARALLARYGAQPAASAPVAAQAQPVTAADAVFGLMAWLSGRDEVVTLSARHGAAIAADLAEAFCEANGLQQFSDAYPDNLKYPKSTLAQPAAQADDARDAARYRWLRKNWQFSLHGQPVWVDTDPDLKPPIDSTTKLDELIDAARQGEGGAE